MLTEKFNEAQTLIATGEENGNLSVRQAMSRIPLWHAQAHPGAILALDWSPDGGCLASGGQDGVVRIWDTKTGMLLDSRTLAAPIGQLCWSPDGEALAIACGTLPIHLWHLHLLLSTHSS